MEYKDFKMDKNLLFHVITSQTGSRAKALGELVMNAIDAGGSEIHIDIKGEGFSVSDNGKGFSSMDEVENFFRTFGTPHHAGDGAKYGKFRMGRGQIMAYAPTMWLSGAHRMDVDIKNKGMGYLYKQIDESVEGCSIEGECLLN